MTCAREGLVNKVWLAVCSVRFKAPEAAEEEKEKATEFCRQISRSLKGETIAGALIVLVEKDLVCMCVVVGIVTLGTVSVYVGNCMRNIVCMQVVDRRAKRVNKKYSKQVSEWGYLRGCTIWTFL